MSENFLRDNKELNPVLWQARRVGWGGRWEEGCLGGRGHMYTCGWFMLMCGRGKKNIVEQLFSNSCILFNASQKKKKKWGASGASATSKLCREIGSEGVEPSPLQAGLPDFSCLCLGTGENRGTFWANWIVLRGNSQGPSSLRVGCSAIRPLVLCCRIRSHTFRCDLLDSSLLNCRLQRNI